MVCPQSSVILDRQINGAPGNMLAAIGRATGIPWDGRSG
jgi:hypothetical protein